MAVDITLLFRASVKTVKTRNKALGVAVGGGVDGSRDELFRRSPRPKGDFSSRAREVISHIGKLRDFLLEHRKDYISAHSHLVSEYGRMTDSERDQIDQDAQTFIRTCSEAIQQLRNQALKEIHSQQVKEHRNAVLDFTEDYLKRVCKLYSEQRAIRVKRVVDKKRLSKLEPEANAKTRESVSSEEVSQDPSKDPGEKPVTEEYPEKIPTEAQPELGTWGDGRGEDELSPEEIQMFEQENQRLIGEMNSLFDEVRQIEGKVVEISRLQEIFTEKVLQQEAEIDSIHQLVVGATENIKEGNEDIREGEQRLQRSELGRAPPPGPPEHCALSPGHQEQRRLPSVGAVLPGDVLLLPALPRLVRQLAGRSPVAQVHHGAPGGREAETHPTKGHLDLVF
uniref:Syntaxin-18 n=1 Tax=Molossus molossus TaxID=27622 RepID=A0A7J8K3E6_MOLMO|nr:syntaxin 18 [Molossus molossus]